MNSLLRVRFNLLRWLRCMLFGGPDNAWHASTTPVPSRSHKILRKLGYSTRSGNERSLLTGYFKLLQIIFNARISAVEVYRNDWRWGSELSEILVPFGRVVWVRGRSHSVLYGIQPCFGFFWIMVSLHFRCNFQKRGHFRGNPTKNYNSTTSLIRSWRSAPWCHAIFVSWVLVR